MDSTKKPYTEKGWYRVFRVIHWLTYGFLILLAFSGAQGHSAWGYTDPINGQYISYPAIPFQWHMLFMIFGGGMIIIELLRAILFYIIVGKSVISTIEEVF